MLNLEVKNAIHAKRYAGRMDNMGDRIRQLRVARGMTQTELATMCGVTKSAVSQWENGHTANIRLQAFLRLVEALQTDPQYLIWGPSRNPRQGAMRRQGGM